MAITFGDYFVVFPTRVGVDRIVVGQANLRQEFSPHAWGWTESMDTLVDMNITFSPHAWGWTADGLTDGRFPHTRGGGP